MANKVSTIVAIQRSYSMAKLVGIFVVTILLLASSSSHALAFSTDIHTSITLEALSFLKYDVLLRIASANVAIDSDHGSESMFGGLFHDKRTDHAWHFDNCLFAQTSRNINDQYLLLLSGLFDGPVEFGKLLHPAQDFYAHSNWVELGQVELIDEGLGLWTELNPFTEIKGVTIVQGETFEEPYLPPGVQLSLHGDHRVIVNDTQLGLVSGLSGWWLTDDDCPDQVTVGHDVLNKDYQGRPGFDAARSLAVKQTRHEWCRLVSLYSTTRGTDAVTHLYEDWVANAPAAFFACLFE